MDFMRSSISLGVTSSEVAFDDEASPWRLILSWCRVSSVVGEVVGDCKLRKMVQTREFFDSWSWRWY